MRWLSQTVAFLEEWRSLKKFKRQWNVSKTSIQIWVPAIGTTGFIDALPAPEKDGKRKVFLVEKFDAQHKGKMEQKHFTFESDYVR